MPRRKMKSNFDHTKFLASSPLRMPDLGQYKGVPGTNRNVRQLLKKEEKKANKRRAK